MLTTASLITTTTTSTSDTSCTLPPTMSNITRTGVTVSNILLLLVIVVLAGCAGVNNSLGRMTIVIIIINEGS